MEIKSYLFYNYLIFLEDISMKIFADLSIDPGTRGKFFPAGDKFHVTVHGFKGSGFSPASGIRSCQFDRKRDCDLAEPQTKISNVESR